MQTLTLDSLPTPVLLVWGLPEDAETPFISPYEDGILGYWRYNGHLAVKAKIPKGNWQLIGKLSELTEEQAGEFVGKNYWDMSTGGYIDYNSEEPTDNYTFALESFHSAVETSGYHIPTPKPLVSDYDNYDHVYGGNTLSPEGAQEYAKELKKWQEAQSKTLPDNTLIFKKK